MKELGQILCKQVRNTLSGLDLWLRSFFFSIAIGAGLTLGFLLVISLICARLKQLSFLG